MFTMDSLSVKLEISGLANRLIYYIVNNLGFIQNDLYSDGKYSRRNQCFEQENLSEMSSDGLRTQYAISDQFSKAHPKIFN